VTDKRLLRIEEAADMLGVPCASLRTAATEHGLLIRMGRALRLRQEDLAELIEKCRCQPEARAYTSENAKGVGPSTLSKTLASPSVQRAQTTAAKLKASSPATSQTGKAQVVPLSREK